MKILLVGNINSIWVRLYIEKVLLKISQVKIYVLTFENYNIDNKYTEQFGNNIKIFENKQNKWIKAIKSILWCKKNTKDDKFDFIHIHYMPNIAVTLICRILCHAYANEVILTYYGSDLFDKSILKKYVHKILLKKAKFITMATNNMINTFYDIYRGEFKSKIRKISFGFETIDEIEKIIKDKNSVKFCKEQYGINPYKKSIAIGYNGRETQKHIAVIEEIAKLDKKFKNDICVVIHLGYNLSSDDYRKQIIKKLNEIHVEYVIIDNFLDLWYYIKCCGL